MAREPFIQLLRAAGIMVLAFFMLYAMNLNDHIPLNHQNTKMNILFAIVFGLTLGYVFPSFRMARKLKKDS